VKSKADFLNLLADVSFGDWTFSVGEDGDRLYLQLKFEQPCTTTGEHKPWSGRKWFLSPHMTDSEVITTAFKAVITSVEHEAREKFRWRDRAIFGPHVNVHALYQVAERLDVRS
jgi:hypothetical protein